MKPKIVVVGSSNTDMVIKLARLPSAGETLMGQEFVMVAGGKGANQAVAAARLGAEVLFLARVGTDLLGDRALEGFKNEGLGTDFIVQDETHPSGVALIMVDEGGENMIAVASGANGQLRPQDIDRAQSEIGKAAALLMQLEVPLETVRHAANLAHSAGVRVILNPAPARELDDELLSHIAVLTPNETETESLTGVRPISLEAAREAGDCLIRKGVAQVIFTRGSSGCFLVTKDRCEQVPSFPVKAVDTTAAGDAFNGALACALAENAPMREAVEFANRVAAFSVTRLGAQPSLPTRALLEDFYTT